MRIETAFAHSTSAHPITKIVSVVAGVTGVSEESILHKGRLMQLVTARHIAFYIAYEYANCSFSDVAAFFRPHNPNICHGTVMHGVSRVRALLTQPNEQLLRATLERCTSQLTFIRPTTPYGDSCGDLLDNAIAEISNAKAGLDEFNACTAKQRTYEAIQHLTRALFNLGQMEGLERSTQCRLPNLGF